MDNNKYEPIKFETWQELAKYVIDGGEVYWFGKDDAPKSVGFSSPRFDADIPVLFKNTGGVMYIKKQATLEELIAIKPRLCWIVYGNRTFLKLIISVDEFGYNADNSVRYDNAQMLTDDEIKKFFSDGDNK